MAAKSVIDTHPRIRAPAPLQMPTAHPLDPLIPAEISRVRDAILGAPEHAALARGVRFITVDYMTLCSRVRL